MLAATIASPMSPMNVISSARKRRVHTTVEPGVGATRTV